MNEHATPADPAPPCVAKARRGPSYGWAFRLDWRRLGGLPGRAEFIHGF